MSTILLNKAFVEPNSTKKDTAYSVYMLFTEDCIIAILYRYKVAHMSELRAIHAAGQINKKFAHVLNLRYWDEM